VRAVCEERRARESNPQLLPATDFESASKLQNPSQNEQKQAGASLLLPERYLEATSIDFAELSEQLDTEALLERDAFEEAFDAKVGGHEPPSDTRRPADAVPSGESLSITQIRVAFVDVAGRTRSDSYIRGAIAELARSAWVSTKAIPVDRRLRSARGCASRLAFRQASFV
jgi:hypothetical protein